MQFSDSSRRAALLAPAALLVALIAAPAARAQQTAVGFTADTGGSLEATASQQTDMNGNLVYNENASLNLGYEFTVNSPIAVTQLGFFTDPFYYDPNNPNYDDLSASTAGTQTFAQSHDVGVYLVVPAVAGVTPETGVLLFSATVTQADPKSGFFRYAAPTLAAGAPAGFLLSPGASYVIAGVTGPDDPFLELAEQADGTSAVVTDPAVNFIEDRTTTGGTETTLASYPGATEPNTEPAYFGPNFQFTAAPEPPAFAGFALGALGLGALGLRARKRMDR